MEYPYTEISIRGLDIRNPYTEIKEVGIFEYLYLSRDNNCGLDIWKKDMELIIDGGWEIMHVAIDSLFLYRIHCKREKLKP